MSFETVPTASGWQCVCEECGDYTSSRSLARIAGWMARHVCKPGKEAA